MSDVGLAKFVIKQYSDGLDGLSSNECDDLIFKGYEGVHLKNSQCRALQDTFGYGREGTITKTERERLKGVGFSKKFIDELAGKDGRKALRRRARWLGEFYLSYNKKIKEHHRRAALEEMLDIGVMDEKIIPALIEATKHKDDAMRAEVAKVLGKFGPKAKSAIPALIEVLNDEKGGASRIEAARALGNIGYIGVAKHAVAVNALGNVSVDAKDQELRIAAIEAFTEICSHPNFPKNKLEASIYWPVIISQDDDEKVLLAVNAAFKKLRVSNEAIVKTLVMIVLDKKMETEKKILALQALGRMRERGDMAVSELKDICKSPEYEDVRIYAIDALALIGTPGAFKALKEIGTEQVVVSLVMNLELADTLIRSKSARLIGELGSEKNISDLSTVLDDPDSDVRAIVVNSIGKLGKEGKAQDTIKVLSGALDDEYEVVRTTAIRWLGKMGPAAKAAYKDIVPLLEDVDVVVRKAAVTALLKIDPAKAVSSLDRLGENGGDAVPVLRGALKTKNRSLRRAVLQVLEDLGGQAKAAVPDLVNIMKEGETKERVLAARALGEIGDKSHDTYRALLQGSIDSSKGVRKASIRALDKLGYSMLIWFMGRMDEDIEIRKAAVKRLGKLGHKALPFLSMLISLLQMGSDEQSRIMAAYVIGKIGPKAKDAGPALVAARDGGSKKLKKAASRALKIVGYKEPKVEVAPEKPVVEKEKPEEVATVADLVEIISSGESADRRKAAVELSKMGKEIKKVQGSLITLLKEGDDLARELSAVVLFSSKSSSKKVLKAWVHALADSDKKVSSLATAALNKNAKKAAPFLIAVIKKGEEANKIAALKCLAPMGKLAKPAIKTIAKFLDSDSASLRKAASDAIMKLGKYAAPIIPNLIAKLDSEKRSTRTLAVIILWKLGARSKKVIKALIKRLDDEDKGVRTIARMALTKIGGDAVPFLIKAYSKGSFSKKIAILAMLGELGTQADEATSFLMKVMAEGEPMARKVAAGILMRLGVITPEEAQEALESK